MMRKAFGVCVLAASLAMPPASAGSRIVEIPVTFSVQNVNRSLEPPERVAGPDSPCASNGLSYEIRGQLVAPRSVLARPSRAVTLYLHPTSLSAFPAWRFGELPGYDYALEMARLGHASVIIDRLGYGTSPWPHGMETCTGSQADMAHQIVGQLRAGDYRAGGPTPSFDRVALAGHSYGGLMVPGGGLLVR